MSVITTMIAVGKWNNKENLNFVPVGERVNGVRYTAYGVPATSAGDPAAERRPYKIEDNGTDTYIMYDDDSRSDVPIYRITREA